MPAAAVIPAPKVYAKVVAVEKLVVGCRARGAGPSQGVHRRRGFRLSAPPAVLLTGCRGSGRRVYFEKIRVFKAGRPPA